MGNSLNSERTNLEKLEELNALQKDRTAKQRKSTGIAVLVIGLSLLAVVLSVYALMTREATVLFKLALILDIVATLGMFIAFFCCAETVDDRVTGLCLLLTVVHLVFSIIMITRGRFKIDEVVTLDDGFVYDVIDGEYYLYDCGNKVSDIVVSELSHPIVGFSDGLKGNKNITSVTIDVPEFTVRKNAFAKCTNLQSVTFGDGIYTICGRAFSKCTRLESVEFNGGSYTFKGGRFFAGCDRLKDIYMMDGTFTTNNKLARFLAGLKSVAVHMNDSAISLNMKGAKDLTLVLHPGAMSIGKIQPDVLVLQEGFDFEGWVDTRNTSNIKPIAPVIYIPYTVTNIPERFFGSNSSNVSVYYQGDAGSWSSIYVEGTDGWIFASNSNYSRNFLLIHYNADCKYWDSNMFVAGK
ncbi:MAG: leucine-rich repeat protein [Clostridia bacterium]|nr:leucine-rich repeat protein [Clostridia bacterium]